MYSNSVQTSKRVALRGMNSLRQKNHGDSVSSTHYDVEPKNYHNSSFIIRTVEARLTHHPIHATANQKRKESFGSVLRNHVSGADGVSRTSHFGTRNPFSNWRSKEGPNIGRHDKDYLDINRSVQVRGLAKRLDSDIRAMGWPASASSPGTSGNNNISFWKFKVSKLVQVLRRTADGKSENV